MLRAALSHTNNGAELKLEGRLVGAWAVQVKSLVARHFVQSGLRVELSEVICVDFAGEQLLRWLRDLQAIFVAETRHALDICESLQLEVQGALNSSVQTLTDVHLSQAAPLPRPGELP